MRRESRSGTLCVPMVRVRLVTTPMWSQEHLVAALAQVEFPHVEVNRSPVPLESWRGTPLGVDASLVIRRRHLSAASDDLGFSRNDRGSFEMILSEGNFFRFDRRWIEDVARRHDLLAAAAGRSAPANLPGWEKRYLGVGGTSGSPHIPASSSPPSDARVRPDTTNQVQNASRARAEAATTLDELRKKQKRADGPGCILGLVGPLAIWGLLASLEKGFQSPGAFFLVVLPLWIAFAIVRGVRIARRTQHAAKELVGRLPSGPAAKESVQEYLRTKVKPAGGKFEDSVVKDLMKALKDQHN